MYISGTVQLKASRTHLNKFERNQMDEFFVEAVNIGELRKIKYLTFASFYYFDSAADVPHWWINCIMFWLSLCSGWVVVNKHVISSESLWFEADHSCICLWSINSIVAMDMMPHWVFYLCWYLYMIRGFWNGFIWPVIPLVFNTDVSNWCLQINNYTVDNWHV